MDPTTEDELLLHEDDESLLHEAQLESEEVDQLLAEDEDDEISYQEQKNTESDANDEILQNLETETENPQDTPNEDAKSDQFQETKNETFSKRRGVGGRGGTRGFNRGRGIRGMFPPFRGGRMPPPFFRHPMGYPGARHLLMRGPIRPPMLPHMLRRMNRGGPLHRGGRGAKISRKPSQVEIDNDGDGSGPSNKPMPLMSIETPFEVKAMVDTKMQRDRVNEMQRRQQTQRLNLKRTSSSYTQQSSKNQYPHQLAGKHYEPSAKRFASTSMIRSAVPGSMSATSSVGSLPNASRSNLRQIQCVEDKPMTNHQNRSFHYSQTMGIPKTSSNPNLKTLTHNQTPINPATNRPQFRSNNGVSRMGGMDSNTHNGNLRTIPLVGTGNRSTRLRVSNLPPLVTFDEVSRMTSGCGNVKSMQFDGSIATIEFTDISSAERFFKMYNLTMMKQSLLEITRI